MIALKLTAADVDELERLLPEDDDLAKALSDHRTLTKVLEERDEEIGRLQQVERDFVWWRANNEAEQARKQRDEALARAERAEAALQAQGSAGGSLTRDPNTWPDSEPAGSQVRSSESEVLAFASYCGDDNPLCSHHAPCPRCLGMSNVYRAKLIAYVRELSPDWSHDDEKLAKACDFKASTPTKPNADLVERLCEALEPIAEDAANWAPVENDGHVFDDDCTVGDSSHITVGNLRHAARVYAEAKGQPR